MPKTAMFPDCFDEVKQISITWLRQLGFLRKENCRLTGSLRWVRGDMPSGSVGATVEKSSDYNAWLELDYLSDGNPVNYRVKLESLPSNLGKGRVWYFICPSTGKRCRKLYGIGKYFLSRFAYPDGVYSKQIEAKGWRDFRAALEAVYRRDAKYEFLQKPYSKTFYNGKPTRRYLAMLDQEERALLRFSRNDPTACLRSFPKRFKRS